MKIHVVRRGESIYSIAKDYGVNPLRIMNVNGLSNNTQLVIGQTLIIPSTQMSYRVKPGDSIFSIARRFGISQRYLAAFNGITSSALMAGQTITIPEQSKNYGYIETNGFIIPTTPQRENQVMDNITRFLTYISPFSYHVSSDGSLVPVEDSNIISAVKYNRVAPLMAVSNISGAGFDTELIHGILNSTAAQTTLTNNILQNMRSKGYYGVIIDFERIPPEDKTRYNDFLRKLTSTMHSQNYIVATALAPKTSGQMQGPWYSAHDYPSHGQIVDFVIIMTYEWGWSGGPPMAVAPLNEIRKVINYAVSVIPPKKIMMGMPFYGYDWTLPYVQGGKFAEAMGMMEAVQRAAKYGAEIKFDNVSKAPFYNYTDENGKNHVVWFEDARTVQAKYLLVSEFGLRGVSYWVLAQPFPANWAILNNMFNIVKVVK